MAAMLFQSLHYSDDLMSAMASQINGVSIVHSTVFFQAQIKENIKAPRQGSSLVTG